MSEAGERKEPGFGISGTKIDIPEDKFATLVDKLISDKDFRDRFERSPVEALAEVNIEVTEEGRAKIEETTKEAFASAMVAESGEAAYPIPAIIVGVKVATNSRTTIVPRVLGKDEALNE
jgi:putative modified peptide